MQYNLVIDLNYIFMKNVFSLNKVNMLYGELERSLQKNVDSLKKLYNFENVYLACDGNGGSWRKALYQEYKATRKKDSTIDWEKVYQMFDNFKKKIKETGSFKVLEAPHTEGDDWISYIVKQSNSEAISVLIITSDKDILQEVKIQMDIPSYMNIMMNNEMYNEKMYIPVGYEMFLQKFGGGSNSLYYGTDEGDVEQLVYNLMKGKTVEEVFYEEKLFIKLVSGDKASDNIESVYEKNGRGIGGKGAEKIYAKYKEAYGTVNDSFCTKEFVSRVSELVCIDKKLAIEEHKDDIMKNLLRNLKLIMLHERFLPESVKKDMKNAYNNVHPKMFS